MVIAFRFVGIDGKAVQNAVDAKEAFRKITEGWDEITGMSMPGLEKCRVLIITEEVADWLGELLVQWQLADKYPLIVEIPGMIERLPGHKTLVESIREAIGVHI